MERLPGRKGQKETQKLKAGAEGDGAAREEARGLWILVGLPRELTLTSQELSSRRHLAIRNSC